MPARAPLQSPTQVITSSCTFDARNPPACASFASGDPSPIPTALAASALGIQPAIVTAGRDKLPGGPCPTSSQQSTTIITFVEPSVSCFTSSLVGSVASACPGTTVLALSCIADACAGKNVVSRSIPTSTRPNSSSHTRTHSPSSTPSALASSSATPKSSPTTTRATCSQPPPIGTTPTPKPSPSSAVSVIRRRRCARLRFRLIRWIRLLRGWRSCCSRLRLLLGQNSWRVRRLVLLRAVRR